MDLMPKLPDDRSREILGALLLALTVFLFFALVTDEYQGSANRPLDGMADVDNLCGAPGAVVASVLYLLLGHAAHVLYFLTCVWALMLFRHRPLDRFPSRMAGLLILTASTAGLLHLNMPGATPGSVPGGALGAYVGQLTLQAFGVIGANVIVAVLAIVGILLATEFLFFRAFKALPILWVLLLRATSALYHGLRNMAIGYLKHEKDRRQRYKKTAKRLLKEEASPKQGRRGTPKLDATDGDGEVEDDLSRIRILPSPPDPTAAAALSVDDVPDEPEQPAPEEVVPKETAGEKKEPEPVTVSLAEAAKAKKRRQPRRRTQPEEELPPDYEYPKRYRKPSLNILDRPTPPVAGESLNDQLRQTSLVLERALETHGIEARVMEVTRGPTITRYELEPAPGIKVARFHSLADDVAMALRAQGVRVEAPIPGKGRVGIEMPNFERDPVVLRELLESSQFKNDKGTLALAMGKDIAGDVVSTDLTAMPHLLIAGATGAGKSVCTKALLASLLFNHTPDELQLVLIDPKMVEFSFFNDIPHLITPVVIDSKKAAAALNWLVCEMDDRYRLFAQLRVRNIESYNESVVNGEIEIPGEEGEDGEAVAVVRKLPYVVCVIDELADLMMLARSEVEDAIMRLAQLARAVGIHLVIATQRPSVNVLTGVIKANFPVRVAFQVSSKVDSRCILEAIGAERLIGQGDMLYLPAGKASPTRIQGAFVSDVEMNALITYLKTQAPPQYRDEIENFGKQGDALLDLANESDDMFDDAVQVVLDTGQASISMVQRRLRVGYTRAARLIDMMEIKGIVGPHVGSKAREILVDGPPPDKKSA